MHARNAWLTYGPALHRAREVGLREKLFDLLDEVRRCLPLPGGSRGLLTILNRQRTDAPQTSDALADMLPRPRAPPTTRPTHASP